MRELDFNSPSKIYFTGIGGISMSALAEIMLSKNFEVAGSDMTESEITKRLSNLGAKIYYDQSGKNVPKDAALLVYTAAVGPNHPEILKAKEYGIPTITRAEFLGRIMKNYSVSVGVSGTHGKTTTTSMLSQVMLLADLDPTILVGGIMPAIKGNTRIGHSDTMITEACEYTNSFLSLSPTIGIILNIAADHLDFFKDINDIRHSFRRYAQLIPKDGALIINGDIDHVEEITDNLCCKVITFGTDPLKNNYSATNITFDSFAHGSYDLVENKERLFHVSLKVAGMHNVINSLSVIAAARFMGIDDAAIQRGLLLYEGTDRRFQYKGKIGEVDIIDDYAHHPDEIRTTINTAQSCHKGKLWVVFQPHTYTRTKALLDEFANALSLSDAVVLADIYAAREQNTIGISSKDLLVKLKDLGTEAYYFPSFDEIENFLLQNCKPGDLLITMGAGDVVKIGDHLLGK